MMFSRSSLPAGMNARSLALKDRLFPMKTIEGKNYIDLAKVLNAAGTGTLQRLRDVDREILRKTHEIPTGPRGAPAAADVSQLYQSLEQVIQRYYTSYGL